VIAGLPRTLPAGPIGVVHMIKLVDVDQVDDQHRERLTEAYDFNTDENGS
jgi:hypothetical protein